MIPSEAVLVEAVGDEVDVADDEEEDCVKPTERPTIRPTAERPATTATIIISVELARLN